MERTGGGASVEARRPSSMGKKPATHIVDADREIPATFDSRAKFSLCGVFSTSLSRWTTPIRRARDASGSPSRDAG